MLVNLVHPVVEAVVSELLEETDTGWSSHPGSIDVPSGPNCSTKSNGLGNPGGSDRQHWTEVMVVVAVVPVAAGGSASGYTTSSDGSTGGAGGGKRSTIVRR